MTLRKIPNPNLLVYYSDEISIVKTTNISFGIFENWTHTGMSLEVKT